VRRRRQRLELTARGTVEHVPASQAKALAQRVGRFKITLAPSLGTLGQQLLGLVAG
jgi:hypothetical protein